MQIPGGLFIPAAREMVEMAYEFEKPFWVDARNIINVFGEIATPHVVVVKEAVVFANFSRPNCNCYSLNPSIFALPFLLTNAEFLLQTDSNHSDSVNSCKRDPNQSPDTHG